MSFYCTAIDEQLAHPDDAPTIGLVFCQTKNKLVAEYALKGLRQPLGVSAYSLTQDLPSSLKSSLPSIEELEFEFEKRKLLSEPQKN